jgi:aryl-alcohol dehydrogenase-like predicted oxidoreductase
LQQYADAHGATTDVVAIAAALSRPWVDIVLSGAVTPAQLDSNLNAMDLVERAGGWPTIAEPPTEYWARRSTLAWQ